MIIESEAQYTHIKAADLAQLKISELEGRSETIAQKATQVENVIENVRYGRLRSSNMPKFLR